MIPIGTKTKSSFGPTSIPMSLYLKMPSLNEGTSVLDLVEDSDREAISVEGLTTRRAAGSGSLDAFIGVASSRSHQQQTDLNRNNDGGSNPAGERYFSVRWMLERERAREASDDCSSAFAIIPVVGVCLLALYIICLDQAAQQFVLWLAKETPVARLFTPLKVLLEEVLFKDLELAGGGMEGGSGAGLDGVSMTQAFA